MVYHHLLPIFLCLASATLFAQTGPGGVGNPTGADNQARNVLWLDASQLALSDNDPVTTWADRSGNANHLGQLGAENVPVFRSDGLGGSHSVVRFANAEDYLSIADNSMLSGMSQLSIIMVMRSANLGGARGIISKRESSNAQEEYSLFTYTGDYLNFDIYTNSDSRSNTDPTSLSTGTNYVMSAIFSGTQKELFLQTVQAGGTQAKTGSIQDGSAPLILGALNQDYGTYFSGDIAEVIMYTQGLNEAQRLIVENYLSEKYGLTVTNDFYAGHTGDYTSDVAGVGNSSGETHDEASSAGLTLSIYDGSLAAGEFVMAAHAGDAAAIVTDSLNGNAVAQERWSKTWYVDKTGNMNVSLAFDFGEVIGGDYPQEVADYRLIRRNGADYEAVTTAAAFITDDNLVFNIEDAAFLDGYYTIATVDNSTAPLDGGARKVWYSFKNGNWEDPLSWTLDGAVAPLYVNPGALIPGGADKVVINSGKTISMRNTAGSADYNGVTVGEVELIGNLDLGTSHSHSFGTLLGTGRLVMEGSSVDDSENFPGGNTTAFTSSTGGTVELQGDGLSLSQSRTYNNLLVNMTADDDLFTITADLSLNGDLTVNMGTFQINDAGTTSLSLEAIGDVYVGPDGHITTGTGNARHQFDFYGDLTNDGEVAFTQRTTPTTGSEATDGIVDASFLNDNADQSIQCNNTTHFYRIEIDKGVDDTYVLHIDAASAGYFNLNGYAAQGHGEVAQLTTNTNALGLLTGTVRIGENVTVGALNTGGNYNISEAARLWVDGGSVTKPGGTAIVPYGGVLVSGGMLTASINSGITTRGNGYLEVTGGRVLMNQFRTSVNGVENQGGYIQSGGDVYVSGGTTSTDYYAFSLTYEGNAFIMSGGRLTVNANSRGGLFINGADGNYSVTGGEIVCELDNNNDFVITSIAPFYNLTVRKTTNNTGYVILDGGTTAVGSDDPRTLAVQPLTVSNDLTIQNSSATFNNFDGTPTATGWEGVFDANGVDITIGGNLIEQDGATFTSGANTITFDGTGLSELELSTASTQVFENIVIDKNYSSQGLLILAGNATAAFETSGELRLEKGKLLHGDYVVSALGSVYLADTVGEAGSTGSLILNGAAQQALATDGIGAVYNLEIDNTNGIDLSGDLAVMETLTLTTGVLDINTNRLKLTNAVAGSGFGSGKMIQTAGQASDKGLELYVDADGAYFFPIGTDANATLRYTPATLNLSSVSDDGYVQIRVADTELKTVNLTALASNLLTYYWRVSHSGFGALPTVDSYVFTAADSDDPDGGATPAALPVNFVPGKVLSEGTFSRSQENTTDISGLTITFDGAGSGFGLENANYTAGDGTTALFTGTPEIYYSADRTTAFPGRNWNANATWSTVGHYSTTNSGSYPQDGDVVFIGFSPQTTDQTQKSHWIVMNVDVDVAQITFMGDSVMNASSVYIPRNASFVPQLTVDENRGAVDLGVISGEGTFNVEIDCSTCNADPDISVAQTATITADFGEFANQPNSRFDYSLVFGNNQSVLVPLSFPEEYPNVQVKGENGTGRRLLFGEDILIRGDLTVRQRAVLQLYGGANGDIEVLGNLATNINAENDFVEFPTSGNERTLTIHGDIIFGNGEGDAISVLNTTPSGLTHTLRVGGSITQNSGNTLDLFNGNSGDNNAVLELFGSESGIYTTTNNNMELYQLKLNKGNDTTYSFTFNSAITVNGDTDGITSDLKAVEIINGKLVLNHSAISLELSSGGADFEIPATAGLEITQGEATVSGDDIGIRLGGLLRINGGTLDMDDVVGNGNNYIEYTNTGSSLLELSAGQLTVGSQLRRNLTSTSGILHYRQTGGVAIFGKNAAPATNRGVFELANASSLVHTGGSLTLVRGINSTSVPSLLIEPATHQLTGSVITIGNADTPAGTASSRIGIKSNIDLEGLSIDNTSGNDPTVMVYSRPLVVNGDLTIAAGATLDGNTYDLTLNGDFANDGTYIPSGNTTTFSATAGTQAYTGAGSANFHNMTKAGAGTLSLAQDITIDNDFVVSAGVLSHGTSAIFVSGDVTIESTLVTTGGQGIVFNGSNTQNLIGKTNSDVSLGRITIDNPEGVAIPDGNGYSFTIADALRLSQGVFNVGGSLLTIGKDGTIEEVNTFSLSNMIQTNSSFSDNGVKKIFNGAEGSFVFPVGESKYTPLEFTTITTIDEDGYFIVRPANELHPSVTDDPATVGEDETLNALQYHWVVKSEGITNFAEGTAQFTYDQSDVAVTGAFTEADYIAARLTGGEYQWDKAYAGTAVNTANNTMSFPLDESALFAGEYTAGIDNAFRDVPEYRTNGDVDFTSGTNWEVSTDGGDTWTAAVTQPAGARIVVRDGDELTINDNNVRLLSTTIQSGGRLVVDPGFYGTRLGNVDGTGTLVVQGEVFPTGSYENFFTCAGGEIEYTSSNSYQVLSGIPNIRAVTLTGSGTRTLAANAINICDDLVIDGPTLIKENLDQFVVEGDLSLLSGAIQMATSTSNLTVNGNTTLTGGSFTGFSGADVTFNGDLTRTGAAFTGNASDFAFAGSSTQNVVGTFTMSKLTVNNTGGGIDLTSGGNITIASALTMVDGLITTSTANTVTLGASANYSGAGAQSYFNGPMTKNAIAGAATYTFPVGKGGRYAPITISNVLSGAQNWTAQYFTSIVDGAIPTSTTFNDEDPGSGYNALHKIQTSDRWSLASSGSNSAFIRAAYGSHNGFPKTSLIRVIWWNAADGEWQNQGGIVSGSTSSGTVVSENAISFSEQQFGLGNAPETLLPVTLVYFEAGLTQSGAVKLKWQTATEESNDRFEIERSADGKTFTKIGEVAGAGNADELLDYVFYDQKPYYGVAYYRLKQVDYDGQYEYSRSVVVVNDQLRKGIEVTIYPNPAGRENLNLRLLSGDETSLIHVRIVDINGREFYQSTVPHELGASGYKIIPDNHMPPGLYFVLIRQGEHQKKVKLLIK